MAHDVEIRKADLEDVFLDVMNKNHEQAGERFAAGPLQGEPTPSTSSVVREAASVGAIQ